MFICGTTNCFLLSLSSLIREWKYCCLRGWKSNCQVVGKSIIRYFDFRNSAVHSCTGSRMVLEHNISNLFVAIGNYYVMNLIQKNILEEIEKWKIHIV